MQENKFTTGLNGLDKLIGGIETGVITQFFGEFGSGKSILVQQLSVTVQLPKEKKGLEGRVIFLDCENTFYPDRIIKISKRFNLEYNEVLKNILYKRIWNFDEQIKILKIIKDYIKKYNVKLLIIDSLTTHLRGEYTGLDIIALRQSMLKKHLSELLDIASYYDIACVITNHVLSTTHDEKKWKLKPVGGNLIGYYCKYIIQLGKIGDKRFAKIYEESEEEKNYTLFTIKDDGLHDVG